jgi:hypothetical protein
VDNPESRAIFPSQSIPNSLIAASSLCPALYFSFISTRIYKLQNLFCSINSTLNFKKIN